MDDNDKNDVDDDVELMRCDETLIQVDGNDQIDPENYVRKE